MPAAELPADPPVFAMQSPAEGQPPTYSFDLATWEREDGGEIAPHAFRRRCPVAEAGEIVVCAPDPEANRVRPLPDTYVIEEGLPRARFDLGDDASLDVHMERKELAGGVVSQRIMVGVKFGF